MKFEEFCPHCSKMYKRKNMKQHLNDCGERIIDCRRCLKKFKKNQIISHRLVCPEQLLKCKYCRSRYIRRNKASHTKEICLNELNNLFKEKDSKIQNLESKMVLLQKDLDSSNIEKNTLKSEKKNLSINYSKLIEENNKLKSDIIDLKNLDDSYSESEDNDSESEDNDSESEDNDSESEDKDSESEDKDSESEDNDSETKLIKFSKLLEDVTRKELESWTNDKLRDWLIERSLPKSGTKDELICRIFNFRKKLKRENIKLLKQIKSDELDNLTNADLDKILKDRSLSYYKTNNSEKMKNLCEYFHNKYLN
jgi:hypothetical protein